MREEKIEKKFLESYDKYADAIYRHCYFRVYNKELAEDLVQETFFKAWRYISQGKKVKDIRPFLYKVATNLIIDNSRKAVNKKEQSLEYLQEKGFDPGKDTRGDVELKIEGEQIIKVLDRLDKKYREVILMRYVDNLTPKEIADILEESANSVSVKIHRGTKKVQEIIKKDD